MTIRILVVDDASFIRDMVKKQLRERLPGVEVIEAVDGNRALAALRQKTVDLILSDWEMPNMGGEELLQEVREQEKATDGETRVPFVMVTSRGDRKFVVQAVESGVDDYLAKPFSAEELWRKVRKQLERTGKLSKNHSAASQHPAAQGFAAHSVSVLTGGRPSTKADKSSGRSFKGKAQLRLDNRGQSVRCVVRELGAERLVGLIQRTDTLPQLFDSVVVDLESQQAEAPPQLNGYIHSVQAAELNPSTQVIRLVVCFVDQDANKQAELTRFLNAQ
ncbi:response regulator [Marinimicrobium sp. ARAG 43.8]|uniref:response regulator n=1 Tax=Marinimicrobium sp. ARAG 43.8 TaxID=3418719 RepID=UPI003CEFF68E